MRIVTILGAGVAALFAGHLPAQESQVHWPQPGYLMAVHASASKQVNDLFMKKGLGRIAAQGEFKEVFDTAIARFKKRMARQKELRAVLAELGAGGDPEQRLMAVIGEMGQMHYDEVQLFFYAEDEDFEDWAVVMRMVLAEEGRAEWEKLWKALREDLPGLDGVEPLEDEERLGAPLYRYRVEGIPGDTFWVLDTGSELFAGIGSDDHADGLTAGRGGDVVQANSKVLRGPGLAVHLFADRFIEMAMTWADSDDRIGIEKGMAAGGFAGLGTVSYGVYLDGAQIREQFHLSMDGGPKGLVAALFLGGAEAPILPLPEPALLHMGGAVDLGGLVTSLRNMFAARGDEDPFANETLAVEEVTGALTGGWSFGASAPGMGALVPRIAAAVNVTSPEAFAVLEKKVVELMVGIEFKTRKHEGIPWTVIQIPNNPGPFVPCYALVGQTLFIADSPTTLRPMLTAAQKGPVAPPLRASAGPAPLPDVAAAEASLVYDTTALYRLFAERYMPMIELGIGPMLSMFPSRGEPLVDPGNIPEWQDLEPYLGLGTGALEIDKGGVTYGMASPVGNPLLATLAATYLPLVPRLMAMGLDGEQNQLESKIAKARLEKVWDALRTWQASFGGGERLPVDLGELVARGFLDDPEWLVVLDDKKPATVEYEDEDGEIQTVATSFRYLPDGKVKVSVSDLQFAATFSGVNPFAGFGGLFNVGRQDDEIAVLLHEAHKSPRGTRVLLTADGKAWIVPEGSFKELMR